jgi:hypothetical protein
MREGNGTANQLNPIIFKVMCLATTLRHTSRADTGTCSCAAVSACPLCTAPPPNSRGLLCATCAVRVVNAQHGTGPPGPAVAQANIECKWVLSRTLMQRHKQTTSTRPYVGGRGARASQIRPRDKVGAVPKSLSQYTIYCTISTLYSSRVTHSPRIKANSAAGHAKIR